MMINMLMSSLTQSRKYSSMYEMQYFELLSENVRIVYKDSLWIIWPNIHWVYNDKKLFVERLDIFKLRATNQSLASDYYQAGLYAQFMNLFIKD